MLSDIDSFVNVYIFDLYHTYIRIEGYHFSIPGTYMVKTYTDLI
jgi:hypothetical protein